MARFDQLPKFTALGGYTTDVPWDRLRDWLSAKEGEPAVDLDPDFQRGHVWTPEQQSHFVEFVLKGGNSRRTIYLNHPAYTSTPAPHCDLPLQAVLVDGKQRVSAILAFVEGIIPAFGYLIHEFTDAGDRRRMFNRTTLRMNINSLQTRREVLQWYLDLNEGGVVHSLDELDRVRALLRESAAPRPMVPRTEMGL